MYHGHLGGSRGRAHTALTYHRTWEKGLELITRVISSGPFNFLAISSQPSTESRAKATAKATADKISVDAGALHHRDDVLPCLKNPSASVRVLPPLPCRSPARPGCP